MARIGLRRIAGNHLEKIECEVAHFDQRVLRSLSRLIFFALAAAAPDLAVEDLLVELDRALQVGDYQCQMIYTFQLHSSSTFKGKGKRIKDKNGNRNSDV
jgi:hypothetical protein